MHRTKKNTLLQFSTLDSNGISPSESKSLSDYMRGQIARTLGSKNFTDKSGISYTVVERSQMDKIFEQFNIQNSGCTDISCAVEYGKMLNAERIVIGTVGLVGETYTISARIVDVETSKILSVADYIYTGKKDNLIRTGIPNIVNELMTGKKQAKSGKKKYYIIGGLVIVGGIIAATMGGGSDGGSSDNNGSVGVSADFPE